MCRSDRKPVVRSDHPRQSLQPHGTCPRSDLHGSSCEFFWNVCKRCTGTTRSIWDIGRRCPSHVSSIFRKRVELKGDLHVPPSEIDSRAVRFLPLLLKSVALETYSQLTLGTLEWRSENTLSNLRLHRMDVTPVAPRSWSDWVEALTAMFAPPNLLANLCRDIATLRQRDDKHPGENVDQYALRISSLFARLLTEAARTRPIEKSSHTFAWEILKIAVFENGLLPAIRLEQIREDPAHSFAAARDRARKHASNNLHGVNVSNLSSVARTSPALKTQLETRLDDVQATIASIIDAPTPPRKQHRGRSKSERPATQSRRDNSTSRAKSNGKKASRTTRPTTCTFQHCMRPTTHRTEDCLFRKLAEKIGSDP